MRSFTLYQHGVDIIDGNGAFKRIFFDQNSGKVYWRYKVPNFVGTKHSGIYLGIDAYGTGYFLHNHYHVGNACLVTASEFSEGQQLEIYNETCTNTPLQVLQIALNQAIKKERYHAINFNCQSYTNDACLNIRKSEDVGKWGERLVFGAVLYLAAKALLK